MGVACAALRKRDLAAHAGLHTIPLAPRLLGAARVLVLAALLALRFVT